MKRRFSNDGLYDIVGCPYSTMFIDENQDSNRISGLYNESLLIRVESYIRNYMTLYR